MAAGISVLRDWVGASKIVVSVALSLIAFSIGPPGSAFKNPDSLLLFAASAFTWAALGAAVLWSDRSYAFLVSPDADPETVHSQAMNWLISGLTVCAALLAAAVYFARVA
jgi:hypothetical protein